MLFNRDVEYALISLIAMGEEKRHFSAKELSAEYQIPKELLAKILQRLSSAGTIVSIQGAHGGYRLDRPLETITLGEVITAVQQKRHFARCLDDDDCSQGEVCNIKHGILNVQTRWDDMINTMTLAEFAASSGRY